ncbi:NAD(P)-dependent dehydrogenase, short-chain alcohol dehydrogenase family [Pedobacter westerhofensis]|uniref:NAD(P)-dependent dehydrogenase, short-chain alcohol dehydrogenase family n=1 Tax=Pedobacter westerhofensis TaxID=425512 RepID=A0A521ALM0_9SPHI|nr:SDR family oxidoreductase [Pedobacter westerhofensis]SMO35682.1 NAD(P)-dependent dehydrogenase, short-chain alcohol dehydrogenase family [Pedobacter westerhofensis]
MDLQLKEKTALVTGSTSGIGFAIARSLAAEGAIVIVNGRTPERVNAAVAKIKSETGNQNIYGAVANLEQPDQVNALIQQYPVVDILVNNAGIAQPKAFRDIQDQEWLDIYQVNVMSGVRLSRAYIDQMLKANWGRIIFISSESGVQIPAEMIQYGVSKTAQIGLSRGLAEMTVGSAVTVNTVLPGPTSTEAITNFMKATAEQQGISDAEMQDVFFSSMRGTSLLKRFIRPEEIASLVTYVASPLSAATNGAALRADGGVIKSAF